MQPKVIYLAILISLFSLRLSAQNKIDSLQRNLTNFASKASTSTLFVHFDKNIYTNSDQVWFTAYLLKSKFVDSVYHTLYVSVISNLDSSLILQESFLIQKGMAYGGFNLPDSVQTGNYRFVVNTNVKDHNLPDGEFVQSIYIKSTTVNPMVTSVSVFKKYDDRTKNGTALLKAISSDNRFVADASVKYTIGKGTQIIQNGIAKTSVIGEVMIDYPADKITAENNTLSVLVQKEKLKQYLTFNLPYKTEKQYGVKFYPEGGYLVKDLGSRVGFEIKDSNGAAVKAKAILFDNDNPIDTIETNVTGMGNFSVLIQANSTYKIKLLDDVGDGNFYPLPEALDRGIVTKLVSAVPDEDLVAYFQSNYNTKVHVVIHNYTEIYSSAELNMKAVKTQRVRFSLASIPVGLAVLTVLDSNYKPLAERVFFAHQNRINPIEIITDQDNYHTREKVNLQLKIGGKNVGDLVGVVSLSISQSNRFSLSNQLNIVDYAYLQSNLNPLPTNLAGTKFNDLNYLENILLIKTWRKYKWPSEIVQKVESKFGNFEYTGAVLKNSKALKTPMELNVISNGIKSFQSDSTGKFSVPFNMTVAPKSTVWLSLNSKQNNYEVKLKSPYDEFKTYYRTLTFDEIVKGNKVLNEAINVSSLSGVKLKEVTVTNKDDGTSYLRGGSNSCGDYVCKFNILNCPNHWGDLGNRAPKKDSYYNAPGGGKIYYQGCNEKETNTGFMVIKGVNLPKTFYISDITNMDEPINFATIYWNYQTFINNKQPTPVSFNTGDLTGKFKIIVQGISSNGLIYGEKEITVNRR